jgi:hypothetical protein
MKACENCGKPTPHHANYCDWKCHVELAEKLGGKKITPNGLPVMCVKFDGTMLEHEHGDHPTYKFPVSVEFVGEHEPLPDWDDSYKKQCHALIYTDGDVALTMYESSYAMWNLLSGEFVHGSRFWVESPPNFWRLTKESIEKITRFFNENYKED